MKNTVFEKIKQLFFPNMFRGHAVMLSSFVTGNIYFILLTAGFSAALGLAAGIITAPIGFLAGAATIYIVRKAVNLEFKGLRKEAEHYDIKLSGLQSLEEGDLLETSKQLYLNRESWKAVLLSLVKFPIGLASLVFITAYLSISASLISAPLIYRYVDLQIYGTVLNTPIELGGAVLAGLTIFILGAQVTEKASLVYLKLNSLIGNN
jgi:hypothetical protein